MGCRDVLNDPENQKYFVWTAGGLKLAPDAPPEVAQAWQAVSGVPRRKARLSLQRQAQRLWNGMLV